jgi:hypothetical protein
MVILPRIGCCQSFFAHLDANKGLARAFVADNKSSPKFAITTKKVILHAVPINIIDRKCLHVKYMAHYAEVSMMQK